MLANWEDFQKMCLFLCPMSHVLLFTCIFQALRNGSFAGSLQDQRAPIALERYMAHIESGILIHGPLLGWATVMGDDLRPFQSDGSSMQYLMPRRTGCAFTEYPWMQHGARQY